MTYLSFTYNCLKFSSSEIVIRKREEYEKEMKSARRSRSFCILSALVYCPCDIGVDRKVDHAMEKRILSGATGMRENPSDLSEEILNTGRGVLMSAYFIRKWIVQEFVLATGVPFHKGKTMLVLKSLKKTMRSFAFARNTYFFVIR